MSKKAKKYQCFIKLERELLNSVSWRKMSISCKRLIDFLCEEHLSTGGKENGNLKAPYDQLVAVGISRRLISRTILEADWLGLIRIERGELRGAVNDVSRYTLTFVSFFKEGRWKNPLGDWKTVNEEEIIRFQRSHKIKSGLRRSTATVPQHDNFQCHTKQAN